VHPILWKNLFKKLAELDEILVRQRPFYTMGKEPTNRQSRTMEIINLIVGEHC